MDFFIARVRRRQISTRRFRLVKFRRYLRNINNAFQATDAEFVRLFRLNKAVCKLIIKLVQPHMQQRTRVHGLNSTLRILCAIRFFAVGCYQRPIGQDLFIGLSQTSVSRCVYEVCQVIEQKLAKQFVKFPLNSPQVLQTKQKFYEMHGFPGVIGLVDGTHIPIKKPNNNVEHVYYSTRKSAHTKNVQVICDANLQILSINARYGGSAHDSFVWNNSIVKEMIMEHYENGGSIVWLLGDSGYALQPWLMPPFAAPSTESQKAYNMAHKKTPHLVEHCIGVLKPRFRCLSRQRILMYSPQKPGLIINCCAILHNALLLHGIPLPPEEDILFEMTDSAEDDHQFEISTEPARILSAGRRIRDEITSNYFNRS